MTRPSTVVDATAIQPRPHSRLCARIVLVGPFACGLPAQACSSVVQPLLRLTYNPSNSVPVEWYRVGPLDHRTSLPPRRWEVCRIVLAPLPAVAASFAAHRGSLRTRIALLKRVGAMVPLEECTADGKVRIDGVPSAAVLPAARWGRPRRSRHQCRRLRPGDLFLVSVNNPASFDSRYFGPIRAGAVICVARPVWQEPHP
uniref:TraF n=1 Tax=Pseudomonas extremaustralis TaxID=359110 RepID=A0AEF9_9PSED|nr:TraF [Pseudomonas extremaustralis 14-3]